MPGHLKGGHNDYDSPGWWDQCWAFGTMERAWGHLPPIPYMEAYRVRVLGEPMPLAPAPLARESNGDTAVSPDSPSEE